MPTSIRSRYERIVSSGSIERDPAQTELIERFVLLNESLKARELASKKSSLGWLFAKSAPPAPPKGIYIWGGVGRGKTMLMDLFFEESPVLSKKRFHFHAFMADVHVRIHEYRQKVKEGKAKDGDPIPPVADELSKDLTLLCFDEFYVVDIADAMILGRLFQQFFENGVTLVATSNVEPSALYPDGLNRSLFLPFIEMLQGRVDIVELVARTDFRLEKLRGGKTYFFPTSSESTQALNQAWESLTGSDETGPSYEMHTKGRIVEIPQALQGVARGTFAELCEAPLAASDYLAIAQRFHTLLIDDVPQMSRENANAARRFINLIDALYEQNVKLLISAAVTPDALYVARGGNEAFAFDRTASRLFEMQSHTYLALPHGATD